MDRVHEICTAYAADNPGYTVPESIEKKRLFEFQRNVRVERDGDIATVTVCRPEVKNALNARTMNELEATFIKLEADEDIRGVVLTSFDGSLAGADINELAALKDPKKAEAKCMRGHAVLGRIEAMSKPVVAAVDGPVLGGGAELVMACHARVVGNSLMLGQPEVNLGIIPGYGGTQRLPRIIGLERGLDLLRTGRPVGAKEACEWGWATGEPTADMLAAAKDLVREHLEGKVKLTAVKPEPMSVPAELPRSDIGHHSVAIDTILLDVIREGLTKPLPEGLEIEAAGFASCKKTVDYNIGMANFIINGPRVPAAFMNE
jgi:enoyl-CoA hydratase/carnithine racemase